MKYNGKIRCDRCHRLIDIKDSNLIGITGYTSSESLFNTILCPECTYELRNWLYPDI